MLLYMYMYAYVCILCRCLKELLDFNAVITKVDKKGNNALHIACIHGQLHIVQLLLQNGLSAELRYSLCSNTYRAYELITHYMHKMSHVNKPNLYLL